MPHYVSSSFMAYVALNDGSDASEESRAAFTRFAGEPPTHTIETQSRIVHLRTTAGASLGHDERGVHVVLHGEVYEREPRLAEWLARRYALEGDDVVRDLHGSFALLVVDTRRDRITLSTDRLGTRRVLHGTYAGNSFLTTRQDWLPPEALELDLAGVAWYLSNHGVYGSRTIYRNVRALDAGTVHELTPHGVLARPYWISRYEPTTASVATLRHEFTERLVAGVRRCLYDAPDVFLSLSGGYDATGMAAILREDLGVRDVHCMTYANDGNESGTDAGVARETARIAGFEFSAHTTYTGNLAALIEKNAAYGHAQREAVDEIDAIEAMAERFAMVDRPALLVGDNTFEMLPFRLKSPYDILQNALVQPFERTRSSLLPLFGDETFRRMQELHASDVESLLASFGDASGPYEAGNGIYVGQRLRHHHMPWRENYFGRYASVRSPYLDNDVVEFVNTVPKSLLRGKRLFKDTIRRMHPKYFEAPRARRSGSRIDVREEFAKHRHAVRALIEGSDSRLDDLVPPAALVDLLDSVANAQRPGRSENRATERLAFVRRALAALPGVGEMRSRMTFYRRPPEPKDVPAERLLMRLLVLRHALVPRRSPVDLAAVTDARRHHARDLATG